MTLHMIKLSVGTDDIADLDRWQRQRLQREGRLYHMTRMAPKRAEDILPDGSIYWVIKGLVLCRQKLTGFDKAVDEAGRAMTLVLLDPAPAATAPAPPPALPRIASAQSWVMVTTADRLRVSPDGGVTWRAGATIPAAIPLDPVLVATVPTPHRAFQGWRYLEPSRAPLDLKDAGGAGLPPELAAELRQLGVW